MSNALKNNNNLIEQGLNNSRLPPSPILGLKFKIEKNGGKKKKPAQHYGAAPEPISLLRYHLKKKRRNFRPISQNYIYDMEVVN